MMVRKFGELPVGARFCFRARRYEKVAPEIGRDEERGGNVFHATTEVAVEMQKAECKVRPVHLHRSPNRRTLPETKNAKFRMQNGHDQAVREPALRLRLPYQHA